MATIYGDLYAYCQTLQPKISTNIIRDKVLELAKQDSVKIIKTGLDIEICRGFFLSSSNTEHPFVKQIGTNVIALARGMNTCWDRFIITKELMHFFDNAEQVTDSPERFNDLLTDLFSPTTDKSPQCRSETFAFWMALGCLCPETYRKQYIAELSKGHIDYYGIALQLRIPEQYVRHLFDTRYEKIINSLIN